MAIINSGGGWGSVNVPMGTAGTWQGGQITQHGLLDPDVANQTAAQRDISAGQNAARIQEAQIGADASKYAASYAPNLQQARFQAVFPWLQGQVGQFMAGAQRPGGQSGPSPEITVGGVLNPQQIQQQVNTSRAANDQATAGQKTQAQQRISGSGFGSNSPLLQALYGQANASNMATNTANETNIRLNAAQQNAEHVLGTQQARETQFANRQREDIQRRTPYIQGAGSLLSAMVGMVN